MKVKIKLINQIHIVKTQKEKKNNKMQVCSHFLI